MWSVPFHTRVELATQLAPPARINAGVDVVFGPRTIQPPDRVTGPGAPMHPDASTAFIVQPGMYLEAELTPARGLRLVPSLRLDVSSSTGEVFLAPRFSGRWAFAPGWAVKGGVGYYVQPPLNERVTIPPELLVIQDRLRTVSLQYERALHVGAGIEHDFSRWISLSVEGFYRGVDHAAVGFPSLDLLIAGDTSGFGNRAPPITSNGLGRAYGLEVLLRHRMSSRFFGWIAYTLMRAERLDDPTAQWRPFEFDQTHNLVVVASYNLGAGWEVGARFRYVTGRPFTLARRTFNGDTGDFDVRPGVPFGSRVFDFHQLDVRIEKRWRLAWGTCAVYLEVLNVYNRSNVEAYDFSFDGAQSRPAGPYLPIFPNLGLRGEL
jgi:hypothetical protein